MKNKKTIIKITAYLTVGLLFTLLTITSKIDSLKNVIETADQDTIKVKTLNALARKYFGPDPKQAFEYSQQAAELAERIKYDKGKADSYNNIARYYWMTTDYPKSIKYVKKKMKI